MAATILADGESIIENVPDLLDVSVMKSILESLGVTVVHNKKQETLHITPSKNLKCEAPYELAQKIRASIAIMGPVLGKLNKAKVAMPGGCPIGARPIDLHLKGLKALGAEIVNEHGYVEITAPNGLTGAEIYLDFPSVGATENILMAATRAQGQTVIRNAAKEPEIIDLSHFLNKMGANIKGAGTDIIKITGVTSMTGAKHQTIPDRLITSTYMIAAAITQGNIKVNNVVPSHVSAVSAKLREMGVEVEEQDDAIAVRCDRRLKAVDLTTLPYPGIPTDVQAPFMALLSVSDGTSFLTETIYENRFMHAHEFRRMGASIKTDGHTAVIQGVDKLTGAPVKATDLRCGASLVICGLVAEGITEIDNIYHIDRGYPQIEEDLRTLGATIYRK